MANPLAVADWTAFVKKNPADGAAPLTKALDAYKASLKDDSEEQVDALNDLIKQATVTRRKNSDKKVLSYIDDVLDDAEKALKAAEKAALEAEKKRKEEEEEEEGEEDAADPGDPPPVARAKKNLKTRLKLVRKLAAEDAKPFFLAMSPGVSGLMVAQKSLSAEHKAQAKLLRKGGKGRVMTGTCFGDGPKLVFVFPVNVSAGYAKAIKKAVKELSKLTVKVRVAGPGDVGFDDDEDAPPLTDFGTDDEEDRDEAETNEAVWKALGDRARALEARFAKINAAAPAVAGPYAGDVAAAAAAVANKAADAEQRLDEMDARLVSAERAAEASAAVASGSPARTVGFRKARDDWDKARGIARKQMEVFQNDMLSDTDLQTLDEWPDIQAAAGQLVGILDLFDDSLAKAITDAAETNPETSKAGLDVAKDLLREYREELAENPIYATMDNGAFGKKYQVLDLLGKSLDQVASKLGL